VNATLKEGDPVLVSSRTGSEPLPGPYNGLSMNCRACHLVAEQSTFGRGNRSYADYTARSPIPDRGDGRSLTVRNAQPIVNALIKREGATFLHNDGEFPSGVDL